MREVVGEAGWDRGGGVGTKGARVMNFQNRYCCRCHCTTKYNVVGTVFTCTKCGVSVDTGTHQPETRSLVGDPFRSFRVAKAA